MLRRMLSIDLNNFVILSNDTKIEIANIDYHHERHTNEKLNDTRSHVEFCVSIFVFQYILCALIQYY